MKLSKWAKQKGICYRTAWNWFHNNQIPNAQQLPSGTIIVNEYSQPNNKKQKVAIYCRVSSHSRKHELEYQVKRCEEFCMAKGLSVTKIFKEVASGMNDKRKKLLELFEYEPDIIIVENKDRLTRFGFNYIETLLTKLNKEIIVINETHEDEKDLMQDMISIVTSFCCRLYGLRRGQNTAKKIKEFIKDK